MLKHQVFIAAGLALAVQTVIAQGLPDEIQAREAGDAQLQSNINNEAAARSAGDSQLQNNINAEAAARAAADMTLQNNIAAEASARSSADNELGGRITDETVSRMQAIEELRKLIGGGGGGGGGTVNVDCSAGGSIANALAAGAARIIVRGTCPAPVLINKDDVVLEADPAGGSIQGTDPNVNNLVVTGHRVTVQGLTVTGGRNGITGVGASNLNVRNVTVQSVGRNGIAYAFGSSGTVDGCTVQSSGRDGIVADGAFARIINCTIRNNTRNGILFVNVGNGTIGLTEGFAPAGNTIQQNGGTGISISVGSAATVAENDVLQNGTGIGVFQATATISGGNTISGNPGGGIVASGSRVILGEPGPGLPIINHITQNGNPTQTGGIFAGLGTSMLIRDAQILSNSGAGLIVSLRSQVQMSGTTIQNNASDGIRLLLGSALLPVTPASTVSGNTGFGVQCFDPESSVVNLVGPIPPIVNFSTGNTAGNIASGCTGFDAFALLPPNPPPLPLP